MTGKAPKKRRARRPAFQEFPDGEAQLERFFAETKKHPRDHALFLLLAKTAIRGVSAVNARWRDLGTVKDAKGDAHPVLWVYGKTISEDRKRWKRLSPGLVEALERWKRVSRGVPDAPIFGITTRRIRQIFARYKAVLGLPALITVHSLRHTAITGALMKGAPLPAVQAMADHAQVTTTARYAHAVRKIEDAAESLL